MTLISLYILVLSECEHLLHMTEWPGPGFAQLRRSSTHSAGRRSEKRSRRRRTRAKKNSEQEAYNKRHATTNDRPSRSMPGTDSRTAFTSEIFWADTQYPSKTGFAPNSELASNLSLDLQRSAPQHRQYSYKTFSIPSTYCSSLTYSLVYWLHASREENATERERESPGNPFLSFDFF